MYRYVVNSDNNSIYIIVYYAWLIVEYGREG